MSIWHSVTPELTVENIGGITDIDVAWETLWNNRIRLTVENREGVGQAELTIAEAQALIWNLNVAISRIVEEGGTDADAPVAGDTGG